MRTPAGKECRYYYEDFHRGRNKQECRLLKNQPGSPWRPSDCAKCPVPEILWANASEDLSLEAEVKLGLLGLGRRVEVTSTCVKHNVQVSDPYIGCEQCAADRPDLADILGSPRD